MGARRVRLFHHEHFWLPRWLLNRSVSHDKLEKALKWMRKPARFIDRGLKPRLTMFTSGVGAYVIAIICAQVAVAMPFMEVVPFSANLAGLVLTIFGLALIACDGQLALVAFFVLAASLGVLVYNLL